MNESSLCALIKQVEALRKQVNTNNKKLKRIIKRNNVALGK